MVCVYCQSETNVTNSRHQKRRNEVWRRRSCTNCGSTFTTHEQAEYGTVWLVLGKDGSQRPFSRDKLYISLYKSLQHRPTAIADATGLTNTIIQKIRVTLQSAQLKSTTITQIAQIALHRFDAAASTHYQAFHKL